MFYGSIGERKEIYGSMVDGGDEVGSTDLWEREFTSTDSSNEKEKKPRRMNEMSTSIDISEVWGKAQRAKGNSINV